LRLGGFEAGQRLGWLGGGLTVAAVLLWLTDISDVGLPRPLSRTVVFLWLLSLAALLVRWPLKSWSRDGARWWGLLVPALLLLSFVVRFVGLGWEAGAGYYRDEGIYRAGAVLINEGELLPKSFIYGHVLYYLAAFALWLQSLFPGIVASVAKTVFRAGTDEQVISIVLRSVSATLGALTTLPVFLIARRFAGTLAGATAALLIIFSMTYNEITHLLISDVPSAFFATLCLLFVARLIDRESRNDYLWAGVCAGLAAASKYPAGVVAVGIVAVWLKWRISQRRWSWNLLFSGLASIAAMLAVMPAILVSAGDAFSNEGKDIFFGLRQYGLEGWIGVIKQSNSLYYGRLLYDGFKLPACILGLTGLFFLPRKVVGRLFWELAYPICFLALLVSMNMAVKRNILPVVPILAVVLGVGVAGWANPLARWTNRRRTVACGLGLVAILLPLRGTVEQEVAMTSIGTRALAVAWIRENIPRGARLVKESYTPNFDRREYTWIQGRFAARRELEAIRDPRNDFLLLARNAYGRFTMPELLVKPHHHVFAERYAEMFTWDKVHDFRPGRTRRGPFLSLYRLDPEIVDYKTSIEFHAADAAFLSGPLPVPETDPRSLRFTDHGEWALFKSHLEAGSYDVTVDAGATVTGRLRVVTRDNHPLLETDLDAGTAAFELVERDKIFVYVELDPGSELRSVALHAR